ncbi:MAG: GNAT family N-acetyltransferase [Alphaproteobacteria bacterium]
MIKIGPVHGADAKAFAALTYPRFRELLGAGPTADGTGRRVTSIGAILEGRPVGLALLRHRAAGGDAPGETRMLSIMVSRGYRRRGIGWGLMQHAVSAARRAESRKLIAYHSNRTRDREVFEAFLAASGWTPPKLAEFRLGGHADWTERLTKSWDPMMRRLAGLGYAAEPWDTITDDDRAVADALVGDRESFNYRTFEPHIDPAISLVLRRHGRLVGWIFGESPEVEGYHHYTNGYVIPELQALGWVVAGLHDVCRRQAEIYGPKSVAVYETVGENARMIGFMKRRLVPAGPLWVDERYSSALALE